MDNSTPSTPAPERCDPATAPWPRYRSHKVVEALLIAAIVPVSNMPDGTGWSPSMLHFDDQAGYTPLRVEPAWLQKHAPMEGGYLVRYPDGYLSWSPREAFEDGYSPLWAAGPAAGVGDAHDGEQVNAASPIVSATPDGVFVDGVGLVTDAQLDAVGFVRVVQQVKDANAERVSSSTGGDAAASTSTEPQVGAAGTGEPTEATA